MTYTTTHYLQAVQTEIMYRAQQILTKDNDDPAIPIAFRVVQLSYIEVVLLNPEFATKDTIPKQAIMSAIHIAYIRDQDDNRGRNGALWEAMREYFYYHIKD